MKRIFPLLLFTLLSLSIVGQVSFEERIEIELKDGYINENIYEFGEKGFVMTSAKSGLSIRDKEWRIDVYDTDLKLKDSKKIKISNKLARTRSYTADNFLHKLHYAPGKPNYQLTSVDPVTSKVYKVKGKIPKRAKLGTEMVTQGDDLFFSVMSGFKGRFIHKVNWKTGATKMIPIKIRGVKPTRLSELVPKTIEGSDDIIVLAKVYHNKKDIEEYAIHIDKNGKVLSSYSINEKFDFNIVDANITKLKNNDLLYIGTYATKRATTSEGLFICRISADDVVFMEQYNFLDLENFMSFTSEKIQKKVEKKKERKEKRGKELKINYRMASHPIIETDEGFVYLGEAYYPTYRVVQERKSRVVSTGNGSRTEYYYESVNKFDGYQYTHAVICAFDKEGKIIWDEIFKLYPYTKPFSVKRFVSISQADPESIQLAFATGDKIITKDLNIDGEILAERELEVIHTGKEGDNTKRSTSNLKHWYDNYFVAYGSQIIKNKEAKDKKRKVYFINKIRI